MNLYTADGYADMSAIYNIDVPFIFVIGGRGTGKTYGMLKYVLENNIKFMYMRRQQSQTDMINKPEFSPFKPITFDNPQYKIGSVPLSKYNAGFYNMVESDGKLKATGDPIGYTCALSTISNLRGFDASDVNVIIYDEFISEKHERPIRHEGDAFLNAYETINRNRELKGQPPVKMIALSNANNLASPIFETLRLIDRVDNMQRKHKSVWLDRDKGIAVIILTNSPISDRKQDTALYRISKDTDFAEMSLANSFAFEDYSYIGSRPLAEYRPVVAVEDVCVYVHKSNDTYYVTRFISGSPEKFTRSELDINQFKMRYASLYFAMCGGRMIFSDYYCKQFLTKIFI